LKSFRLKRSVKCESYWCRHDSFADSNGKAKCIGHVIGRCDRQMTKVVQTEVNEKEYKALEAIAKRRNLTIKSAVRRAIASWIGLQAPVSEDPLLKLKPEKTGVKTDASRLDEVLYGRRQD